MVNNRVERFRDEPQEASMDAYVASSYPNTYYFTGSVDSSGYPIILGGEEPIFIVREQSFEATKAAARNCQVLAASILRPFDEALINQLKELKSKVLGFGSLSPDVWELEAKA